MKNIKIATALVAGLAVFGGSLAAVAPAEAAPVKHFSNCTKLNRAYPHGVGLKGKKNKVGSHKRVSHHKVSPKLYKLNKGMDRDHDGIACER